MSQFIFAALGIVIGAWVGTQFGQDRACAKIYHVNIGDLVYNDGACYKTVKLAPLEMEQ